VSTAYPDLALPEKMREELRKPMGRLVEAPDESFNGAFLVCVGDESCRAFLNAGLEPEIQVFDGKTKRVQAEPLPYSAATEYVCDNPPGRITSESWDVLKRAFHHSPSRVRVVGEEDLLVLPCVLLAPLGALVVYGQPGEGLVVLRSSKEQKDFVRRLLQRFSGGRSALFPVRE
jgi:GTP-dependent dephospho-CoA kinase